MAKLALVAVLAPRTLQVIGTNTIWRVRIRQQRSGIVEMVTSSAFDASFLRKKYV
jgi:hypothetical protein